MRTFLAALSLSLLATSALAQTSPGFTLGQVPTPAQWNTIFSGKADWPIGPMSTPLSTTGIVTTGNITSPAAPVTSGNNWSYNVNSITGTMTGNNQYSAYYWGIIDNLNTDSNVGANINNLFFAQENLGIGHTGNRQLRYDFLNVTGIAGLTDASGRIYVDHQMTIQAAASVGGIAPNLNDAKGSIWAWDANSICTAACINFKEVFGTEIDVGIAAGGSSVRRMGQDIVINANGAVNGTIIDAALGFGAKTGETSPWDYGITFGNPSAGAFPFDSHSTLIGAQPTQLPSTVASMAVNYGIDWRGITSTSGATAFPNAGTNNIGDEYAGNLVVGSSISAQSGSVSSIAAAAAHGLTGGAYYGSAILPTIAIEAPPNSGTPALATVTHMQLNQIVLVTGTDSGCTNGDVLTLTGGTGTQGTITLTVVAGKATSAVVTSNGDYTGLSATPGSTGGTCSVQPTIRAGYGIKTVSVGTAGTKYLAYPLPFVIVSGSNSQENTPAVLTATMSESTQTLGIGQANFTGTVSVGGTAGVNCPAGITAGTVTVVNGIVTHC